MRDGRLKTDSLIELKFYRKSAPFYKKKCGLFVTEGSAGNTDGTRQHVGTEDNTINTRQI